MEKEELLKERLVKYGKSEIYPFHMPGHKRQGEFPNLFSVDITEVEGFDNLHHPEGILRASMDWAASVYGADRTWYLVNGSTCGILSAIFGTAGSGETILMARNCHKSAYHGAAIRRLRTVYVYPQHIGELGIAGGILPEDVDNFLEEHPEIRTVLVVSPTYDGVVSDIRGIAEAVHRRGIPLIVDEAHGAHFSFGGGFPEPALSCGADVVIQSLHKTLGSFTQTAVMHARKGFVDFEKLERYLQIFQSSSPSYVFLAGIEQCIFGMAEQGGAELAAFLGEIRRLRKGLTDPGGLTKLRLLNRDVCGRCGVWDLDESKLVVSARGCGITGEQLMARLREEYGLELEMCGADYVTAITTMWDTEEGLRRLSDALREIDRGLAERDEVADQAGEFGPAGEPTETASGVVVLPAAQAAMTMAEAFEAPWEELPLADCAGRISTEFIYLYPPGIPMAAPGEWLTEETVRTALAYKAAGLPVQGMADRTAARLRVAKNK